ncbi:hypothetical protein AX14_006785 [Amanita brunnescens Koide BX004]|nr:hypothetical protein AX14_006785 [Amanita brunnescens Koide BX004]
MAPGDSWTTMRHKSPSSSTKSSSRAPPPVKILSPLASPALSSLPKVSLLPPALSASPSGARASPAPPDNLWDDYPDSHWEVNNDIYCDSMGCSYDARKNPRPATVAATVVEFDDCSYEEYEDTLFLCKICNISCRRSINKSKIKAKMPLEEFLRRQRSEDDSFSVEAVALPLPPPSAADFPPLAPPVSNPGPTPKKTAPKLTKAEKATQGRINALLAPDIAAVKPHRQALSPTIGAKTPERPARKILKRPVAKTLSEQSDSPPILSSPVPSPVPNVTPSVSPDRVPSPVTPILAVATLQVAHSNLQAPPVPGSDVCKDSQGVPAAVTPPPSPPPTTAQGVPLLGTSQLATRLYGGAPSIGSTEDDDNDNDDGSSASAKGDDTIRPVIPPTLPPFPVSSADEIDAFAHIRYDESRPTSAAAMREGDLSSHYGFESKAIDDLTWSSTPEPADAIPGYKHSDWPDAILQCDDEDAYHFIKRGGADISKIADDLDALMSGDTSWKTMFHAINDCFQFNTVRGSPEEFMCMLAGLAKTWNDDAECRPLDVLTKVINNAAALGRVSSRLGSANTALIRIRNERNQARADRKTLIDKFLKEQDNFKAVVATTEWMPQTPCPRPSRTFKKALTTSSTRTRLSEPPLRPLPLKRRTYWSN